jgi:hypothetical protein
MAAAKPTRRDPQPQASRSPPAPDALIPAGSYRERRPVTTKSTSRSARSRGSPAPAERSEAKLQEIVSVRFSDEELRRIQAYAVILETTPNAVIREACSFFLLHKVGSADYHEALDAYHRRTSEVVDVLEQIKSVR